MRDVRFSMIIPLVKQHAKRPARSRSSRSLSSPPTIYVTISTASRRWQLRSHRQSLAREISDYPRHRQNLYLPVTPLVPSNRKTSECSLLPSRLRFPCRVKFASGELVNKVTLFFNVGVLRKIESSALGRESIRRCRIAFELYSL